MKYFTKIIFLTVLSGTSIMNAQEEVRDVIKTIANATSKKMGQLQNDSMGALRIAVLDFERQFAKDDALTYSVFEKYLSDQIALELLKQQERRHFDIVERGALASVLKEQDLAISDLADQERNIRIGRLLGANIILIGTYQPLSDYVLVSAKMVDVETGSLLVLITQEIAIDERIENLLALREGKKIQKDWESYQARERERNTEKFFGGGLSGYYLWKSGSSGFRNVMITGDLSTFYRKLVIHAGYSNYQNYVSRHYFIFGSSVGFILNTRVGYMIGFPVKVKESVSDNLSVQEQTAHHLLFTFLQTGFIDLSANYSVINGNSSMGFGLSVH